MSAVNDATTKLSLHRPIALQDQRIYNPSHWCSLYRLDPTLRYISALLLISHRAVRNRFFDFLPYSMWLSRITSFFSAPAEVAFSVYSSSQLLQKVVRTLSTAHLTTTHPTSDMSEGSKRRSYCNLLAVPFGGTLLVPTVFGLHSQSLIMFEGIDSSSSLLYTSLPQQRRLWWVYTIVTARL